MSKSDKQNDIAQGHDQKISTINNGDAGSDEFILHEDGSDSEKRVNGLTLRDYVNETQGAELKVNTSGDLLRLARESAVLSIEELAFRMKVSSQKIQAMELNQWEIFESPVFARSLAVSICSILGVDAQAVLKGMPQVDGSPPVLQPSSLSSLLSKNKERKRLYRSEKTLFLKNKKLALLIICIFGALLYFWPAISSYFKSDLSNSSVADSNDISLPGLSVDVQPIENLASEVDVIGEDEDLNAMSTEESLPINNADRFSVGANFLVFQAKEQSWVEVRDANGVLRVGRTLKRGETARVNEGEAPMKVTVGRIDAVQVFLRDNEIHPETAPHSRIAIFDAR